MKNLLSISILSFSILFFACDNTPSSTTEEESFSMVFMTDIHLQPEKNAVEGFEKAIDTINKLNPDFVLTGGDQIMDALGQTHERADSLYKLYKETVSKINVPVYNTVGNHELYGIYEKSGIDSTNKDYDLGMYKRYFGDPYYSFDHKNWHFMVLQTSYDTPERTYIGKIDKNQLEWIKNDLSKIDKATPIVVSVHIPLITSLTQIGKGSMEPNTEGLVVNNTKEVLELFQEYNLKLVLQGHLHYLEEINAANKIKFITGGAVCAGWWGGAYNFTEEGFLLLTFTKNEVDWKYVDYGWDVK